MFCSECGARIFEQAAFCEECGAKIEQASTRQNSAQPEPPLTAVSPVRMPDLRAGQQQHSPAGVMQSKPQAGRAVSLSGLGLTLLALLLPWMQVSCGGIRIAFEGHRMLLGTTQEKIRPLEQQIGSLGSSRLPAQTTRSAEQPSTALILWLLIVVLGAVTVAASSSKDGGVGGLLGSLIGAGVLFYFYSSTNQEVQQALAQSFGLVHIEWSAGFWLAFGGTILVGIGGVIRLLESG